MAKAKQATVTFTVRLAPAVKTALEKAAKAEDRAAAYMAQRFIVEGLNAVGFLKANSAMLPSRPRPWGRMHGIGTHGKD